MTKSHKKPLSHSIRLNGLIEAAVRNKNVKLNLFVQDEDWVAIEGDKASLEFFGSLLLAFASEKEPTCLNFDSEYPLFKPGSEGLILYRKA